MKTTLIAILAVAVIVLLGANWVQNRTAVPFGVAVAAGAFANISNVHKFGHAPDVDTADDPQDLWDCPDVVAGVGTKIYASDSTVYISSDNAGDTTQTLTVEGLDSEGYEQTEEVSMAGITFTQVGSASSWDRVFRVKNTGATALAGNVYIHLDATDGNADGIPDDPGTELLACIRQSYEQTQMTHYTVPRDRLGIPRFVAVGVNPESVSTNKAADVKVMIRSNGGVWRVIDNIGLSVNGTGQFAFPVPAPPTYGGLTDVKMVVDAVAANDTSVIGHYDLHIMRRTW